MMPTYVNRGMSGVSINNRLVKPGEEVELSKSDAQSFNEWAGKEVFTKKDKKHGTDKADKGD